MDFVVGGGSQEIVEEKPVLGGVLFEGDDVFDGRGLRENGGGEVLVALADHQNVGLACLEHVGDFPGSGAIV